MATLGEERILQAMREYTGPMNKRGRYPKGPFMGLTGKAKRELSGTGETNECLSPSPLRR